jgi:hypothetical protein
MTWQEPGRVKHRTYNPVSSVEQPEEPRLHFYPPEEGLRRGRPLPPREEMGLGDDMTDEEWQAFQKALSEL